MKLTVEIVELYATIFGTIEHLRASTEIHFLPEPAGNNLSLLGQLPVKVKYTSQVITLPLVVVKGNKVPLLGRNWLECINLNWSEIFSVQDTDSFKTLLDKYSDLFEEGGGRIRNMHMKAHIYKATKKC